MKRLLSIFSLVLIVCISMAQEKTIELYEKEENGKVTLYAKNNSTIDHNIEVEIKLLNAEVNVVLPIIEKITAGEDKAIAEISALDPHESWTYSIGFTYEIHLEQVAVINDESAVIIYTMENCRRCNYVLDYLINNNIMFHQYSTTNNDANSRAMWNKLKEENFQGGSIQMPVIIANDQTYWNINSLPALMATLK